MKSRWKSLLLWSSAASLAAAAMMTFVRRYRMRPELLLKCTQIPSDRRRAVLWTEHFQTMDNGHAIYACDRYVLQATHFKVWSVLDLGVRPDSSPTQGATVFHVTYTRSLHPAEEDFESAAPREKLMERFYGTVRTTSPHQIFCASGSVARGGILEIRKCHVGGASYGVETGEVHRSAGRLLNYRFEGVALCNEACAPESTQTPA